MARSLAWSTLAQSLRAEHWTDALAATCQLWADHRSLALAQLAEAISSIIELTLPQLPPGKREAMQREWLTVAAQRRPEDLPRLIRVLSETHFRSTDALIRAKRLRAFGVDPRATPLLVEQLMRPRFHAASSKPFWREVFAQLKLHRDPRAVVLLRKYLSRLAGVLRDSRPATRAWFRSQAVTLTAELERTPPVPPLDRKDEAQVREWLAHLERLRESGQNLLEAVYKSPSSNEPRLVLADALQERGEPRGDFITWQINGQEPSRVTELLRKHQVQWLGALAPVVHNPTFERGFPATAYLAEVDDEAFSLATGAKEWGTIRELTVTEWTPAVEGLVTDPAMSALETLNAPPQVLEVSAPLRVTALRIAGPFTSSTPALRSFDRMLATSRAVKSLRHLSLTPKPGWAELVRSLPWVRQIETLGLCIDHVGAALPLGEWAEAASTIRTLRRLCFERSDAAVERELSIVLEREGKSKTWQRMVANAGRGWNDVLLNALTTQLPRGVTHVLLQLEKPLSKRQQVSIDAWRAEAGLKSLQVEC